MSQIDRFQAYLVGNIRDRYSKDFPSRTSIIEL